MHVSIFISLFIYFHFKRWYMPLSVYSLLFCHDFFPSQSHVLFVHSIAHSPVKETSTKTRTMVYMHWYRSLGPTRSTLKRFAQYRDNQIKTIDLLAQFHFNSFHACCSVSQSVSLFSFSRFVSFHFVSFQWKIIIMPQFMKRKKSNNNPIALLVSGIEEEDEGKMK